MGSQLAMIAVGATLGAWESHLLAITGFLGGLTTFSTFSAEVVRLLQTERYAAAAALALVHLIGSLLLTFLGFATYRTLAG